MWRRSVYFCLLLWPMVLAAQPLMNIFEFSMDEEIAILNKLLAPDQYTDRKMDSHNPIAFIFPKGHFAQPLLFAGKFSLPEQERIRHWQSHGFGKDVQVKICHSLTVEEGQYLIITETIFPHECATCPGLLGMALVKGKDTDFTVIKPHTYVAFSGTGGKDSSEIIKLSPTQAGLLLAAHEEDKGNGWQNFTLFEILPMQLTERWRYRTQTDNEATCQGDACFQKSVTATLLAHNHDRYFDIMVRHEGRELAPQGGFAHTVNRREAFNFNAKTGRYELKAGE